MNDELIYNDINDKSKGCILKDRSYSKKLRINSLIKVELMEDKRLNYNGLNKNFFNTTRLLWSRGERRRGLISKLT